VGSPGASKMDEAKRQPEIHRLLSGKRALRAWYRENYDKYPAVLRKCPPGGSPWNSAPAQASQKSLSGFEDLRHRAVPRTRSRARCNSPSVSGCRPPRRLPVNVFHHIPDAPAFFTELIRCLKPGGRALIVDEYPGIPSGWIYRYLHHEPFDSNNRSWTFSPSDAAAGANGALAWIVFERDRALFESRFPQLRVDGYRLHSPLRYWLTGGLRPWCLLSGGLFETATKLDNWLINRSTRFAGFVDIELLRVEDS